jgi:LysR family glycine cleavage system transcriptional activator
VTAPSRLRPLVLDHLRAFEAVARLGGFGLAAEELHVTQSAVSRQIKSLEEDLGAPLFVRGARRVELTQAGRVMMRAIDPALARIDHAVRQIRTTQGRAQVSVSTFASFSSLWLLPRLAGFTRREPAIDIRISATDALVALDDPELDMALRHCLPALAPAGARRLFGEVLSPVVSAAVAAGIARGDLPPLRRVADLAAHTLIDMDDDSTSAEWMGWPRWLLARGAPQLSPRRWISVNFTHQQVQAALAGHGVALVRLPLVIDEVRSGALVEPFGVAGRIASPYAYWQVPMSGGEPREALARFDAWLHEAAQATREALGEPPDASDSGPAGAA